MDNILHFEPIALDRPRGAHRLEAFSLKADRRLTLHRQSALEQWIILEADPAVTACCERPGFIRSEGKRYLADFWVRYFDRQELVILFDSASEPSVKPDARLEHAGLTVRSVQSSEIAACRAWIANWKRMLPVFGFVGGINGHDYSCTGVANPIDTETAVSQLRRDLVSGNFIVLNRKHS